MQVSWPKGCNLRLFFFKPGFLSFCPWGLPSFSQRMGFIEPAVLGQFFSPDFLVVSVLWLVSFSTVSPSPYNVLT